MNIKELNNFFKIIIFNYKKIIKNLFYFIIYLFLVVFSSLIITVPLWYTATEYTTVYTATVLISILLILGITLSKSIKKWIILKQKDGKNIKNIILIPIKKTGIFLLFVIGLYGIIILYKISLTIIAIILTFIYLILLGYYIFVYTKLNELH